MRGQPRGRVQPLVSYGDGAAQYAYSLPRALKVGHRPLPRNLVALRTSFADFNEFPNRPQLGATIRYLHYLAADSIAALTGLAGQAQEATLESRVPPSKLRAKEVADGCHRRKLLNKEVTNESPETHC